MTGFPLDYRLVLVLAVFAVALAGKFFHFSNSLFLMSITRRNAG